MYFYFEGGSSTPNASSLLQNAGTNSGQVGSTELSLLNQIKSLSVDTAFFTDPVYKTLEDYTVMIPVQNVGRPNPFAPIQGVLSPNTSGAGVSPGVGR